MPEVHNVEVSADLWCPFAYVGLVAATKYCDELRNRVRLTIRSWPLELVNSGPLSKEKTFANASALRASVAPELFSGIDHWSYPRSTLSALALAAKANVLDLDLGRIVSMHLRHRLFEDGADLSSEDELNVVAKQFNLERGGNDLLLMEQEYDAGKRRGVKGSPHFFCENGAEIFCPTLDLSRDPQGNLEVVQMASRLHSFLQDCAKG
jgi:hypothetical protein